MKNDDKLDRGELIQGLLYSHTRSNLNTIEAHQARAGVEALVEILVERGVVDREEYEAHRARADQRLREIYVEKGMAVAIQEHETSKYDVADPASIDCENRVQLCKAACCRLSFALSKEDVEEGAVRWDLGHPYFIARASDGCCSHLDPSSRACGVYEQRPIPCRKYDCSKDERVWLDFDKRVPNPRVGDADWPGCLGEQQQPPVTKMPGGEPA